jgi:hypothetical protein
LTPFHWAEKFDIILAQKSKIVSAGNCGKDGEGEDYVAET